MHFSVRQTAVFSLAVAILLLDVTYGQFKNPFKRNTDRQRNNRELTIKDGPWMVMCTSFAGEEAEKNARILANELSSHRFKTYIYRQTFDYSQPTTGIGWQRPHSVSQLSNPGDALNVAPRTETQPEPKKMRSANLGVTTEVAVLVGDFSSVDDQRAQKTLKKIKQLRLANAIGHLSKTIDPEIAKAHNLVVSAGGPLKTAFLLPNPLLPDEYFNRQKVDDWVLKLNKNVKHSLLDCPGLYSVRIASFRGESTFDPNKIKKGHTELQSLQSSGKLLTSSRLIEAEENAYVITKALRERGIEAYEYHDRSESIVCIGSFDWVTRETKDAVINNPEIVALINKLRPEVKNFPGAAGAIIPKSIKGIALDPEPTPILIPKVQETRASNRFRLLR